MLLQFCLIVNKQQNIIKIIRLNLTDFQEFILDEAINFLVIFSAKIYFLVIQAHANVINTLVRRWAASWSSRERSLLIAVARSSKLSEPHSFAA